MMCQAKFNFPFYPYVIKNNNNLRKLVQFYKLTGYSYGSGCIAFIMNCEST